MDHSSASRSRRWTCCITPPAHGVGYSVGIFRLISRYNVFGMEAGREPAEPDLFGLSKQLIHIGGRLGSRAHVYTNAIPFKELI